MTLTNREFNETQQEIDSVRRILRRLLSEVVWDSTEDLPAFRAHVVDIEDSLDALRDELNEFTAKVRV